MKKSEYIAMLMKKIDLPDKKYLYEPVTHIYGIYDDKTKEFVNETNFYYNLSIDDVDIFSEEYCIINPISYKKLLENYSDDKIKTTVDECIYEYINDNKSTSCFASFNPTTGKNQMLYFDLDDVFEEDFDSFFEDIDEIRIDENKKQRNKKNKEETEILKIDKIFKEVTKSIVAQDSSARRLILEICRMCLSDDRNGILLTGSTGVGKTELIKTIGKCINKEVYIVNSTQLTVPGYSGTDIEEILYDLYEKCGNNKEKAENSIIVLDEIDKKGSSGKDDISGKGVLNTLLKFLDGTTYNAQKSTKSSFVSGDVELKTNKMIVIGCGAFSDVYKNMKTTNIGFTATESSDNPQPTIEDFCEKAQMPDEFMGRFPIIIKLNDLSINDLKEILLKSNINPLKSQKNIFKKVGVELKASSEYIDMIAKKAYEMKTGARSLKSAITETTWKPLEKVILDKGIYSAVELTKDTAIDNNKYKLVKKINKKSNTI